MHIGICTIELHLPGNGSLKGKRSILKSLLARAGREFNISIAEVGAQDSWQRAVLGVACVSASAAYAHGLLEQVVHWTEENGRDVILVTYEIEML